jgi:tripartite-type tricarboxylate transporter receptor subunit TctC
MGWVAIMAPHGTSPAAIERVNHDISNALSEREVAERFLVFGYEPLRLTPPELRRLIESDSRRWGELIKRLNIALD